MCGLFELTTKFEDLPSLLKKYPPNGFENNYATQKLIRPHDPVLVVKNECKLSTSIMLWGFISEWAKDPFEKGRSRPFNARSETVGEKKLFRASWRHKRCLIPASGFFEKGHLIRRKDSNPFWLGGIWNRWISPDGSELESCCVLTTEANELLSPFHNRMPVIIPNNLANQWIASVKDRFELKELESLFTRRCPEGWEVESIDNLVPLQKSLF